MRAHEVEVFIGGGGDRDALGTYLVYAVTEEEAEAIALDLVRGTLNAESCLLRHPEKVDELDFDGVLTATTQRWHFFRESPDDPSLCFHCGRADDDFDVHIKEIGRRYYRSP